MCNLMMIVNAKRNGMEPFWKLFFDAYCIGTTSDLSVPIRRSLESWCLFALGGGDCDIAIDYT